MQSTALSPQEYIDSLPEERQLAMQKLRKTIQDNIPDGFEEVMSYGMLGFVVPFSLYPNGYHCNPKLPLPFINIGSQKNAIVMHHMGIYANPELLEWFVTEYPKHIKTKLDMGKGCVRFKKPEHIPYGLIAELVQKITPEKWISITESVFKKK